MTDLPNPELLAKMKAFAEEHFRAQVEGRSHPPVNKKKYWGLDEYQADRILSKNTMDAEGRRQAKPGGINRDPGAPSARAAEDEHTESKSNGSGQDLHLGNSVHEDKL